MTNYINNIIQNIKIYTYNYLHKDDNYYYNYNNANDTFNYNEDVIIDDKQHRINVLLFIKQLKNVYYKYTNKEKFNIELYNTFIDDKNFDGGITGFDDDDDIRIFDNYVIEYIKNRNNVITFLQCKNKNIILKEDLKLLNDVKKFPDIKTVLFVIDMSEKELFNYCYSIIQNINNIFLLKDIIFSIIINYDGQYIRTNIKSMKKTNHPYLILERLL